MAHKICNTASLTLFSQAKDSKDRKFSGSALISFEVFNLRWFTCRCQLLS